MQQWFNCNSITFGYFLLPKCSSGFTEGEVSLSSIIMLVPLSLVGYWFVFDSASHIAFFIVHLSMVQAHCLRRYIQHFTKCLTSTSTKACVNVGKYRQIQILGRYYNLFQQDILIISTIVLAITALVLCLFVIISLGSKMAVAEALIFSTGLIDSILALLLYTNIMGCLFAESKQTVCTLRECVSSNSVVLKDKKLLQKYLRTISPIKVYIGYANYFDELTPLNLFNFAVDQTVSLLLL